MITRPRTAALLTRSTSATTRLLYPQAEETLPHPKGSIAWLSPGEIGFYAVSAAKVRTFVFRTLAEPEPWSTEVPGVSPEVRLLLQTSSRGRFELLEQLLRYLERQGRAPSSLSDGFYLRLHGILNGRLPPRKILGSLLAQEDAAHA